MIASITLIAIANLTDSNTFYVVFERNHASLPRRPKSNLGAGNRQAVGDFNAVK